MNRFEENIKLFLQKIGMLCLPIVILISIDVLAPLNAFTFRHWEALLVKKVKTWNGVFYPNSHISMQEPGGLGRFSNDAIYKEVEVYTDKRGFRKQTECENPDIIVIGDSNIHGANLTQDSIFTEQLERILGECVYPFAPIDIQHFFRDDRFQQSPPKVVLYMIMERNLVNMQDINLPSKTTRMVDNLRFKLNEISIVEKSAIFVDRIIRGNILNYLRSTFSNIGFPHHYPQKVDNYYYLVGEEQNKPVPEEKIDELIEIMKRTQALFDEKGMKLIYAPIPNKESIFWEKFSKYPKPDLIYRLENKASQNNIDFVNIQRVFDNSFQNGNMPYPTDDEHWNPFGVSLAAELVSTNISIRNN